MKKIIALTGGRSGGHVIPLLAFNNYFKDKKLDIEFIWVGEDDSLEEEIANKNKIKFLGISAGKIRRYFDVRNFYEPLKNLTGIFQGFYYVIKYKIDIVFSKGGYVSIPLCIAAKMLGKKVYIHESDIKMGLANKLTGLFATKIFYTFKNDKTEKEGNKHIYSGQILNPELIDGLSNLKIDINPKLKVLVIAGSQGSKNIFENLIKILPDCPDIQFDVILGDGMNQGFAESFKKFGNVATYNFVDQKKLGQIMKQADIAITRGSVTTLWELSTFGIHSIIVPIVNAGDHQTQNAEYFANLFKSNVLDENNNLSLEMFKLLQKYKTLRKGGLNIDSFYKALKIIESEIMGDEGEEDKKTPNPLLGKIKKKIEVKKVGKKEL